MEEDADGYREHNAKVHKQWADANPEKVKQQQELIKTDAIRRFKHLCTYAAHKNIEVDMNDADLLVAKMSQACHYCGHLPTPGCPLNGLDRVDSMRHVYNDNNTVPCCSVCNKMKGMVTLDEFVDNVRKIVHYRALDVLPVHAIDGSCDVSISTSVDNLCSFGGSHKRKAAKLLKVKNIDAVDMETKITLWSSPCYLCGMCPSMGIDRVDAMKDYVEGNMMGCCSTYCNYMKCDWDLDCFLNHITRINDHTRTWVIGNVMDTPLKHTSKEKVPVCVMDDQGVVLLTFPSISKAAEVIKGNKGNLYTSIESKSKYKGYSWRYASAREYRTKKEEPSAMRYLIEKIHMHV